MKRYVIILILLTCISVGTGAAQTVPPSSRAAGIEEYKSADYSRAIDLFKKALQENEKDATSWFMLGSAYLKKGKNKEAVKAFQRADKIDPKSDRTLASLAVAYFLIRDDRASNTAREAVRLNSKNIDGHYLLGQIALMDGSYNFAYERANRVIELNRDHAAAHRLKGEALLGSFAAQGGTIIKPPATRNDHLVEASAEFDKYFALINDDQVKNDLRYQVESLKAFAEFYGKEENRGPIVLDPVPEPGKVPLKIFSKPQPSYTNAARQGNVQGTVHLLVLFLSDGKVGDVLVVKQIGGGLDQEAVRAARQITFAPAQKNGTPVAVVRRVEYSFGIR